MGLRGWITARKPGEVPIGDLTMSDTVIVTVEAMGRRYVYSGRTIGGRWILEDMDWEANSRHDWRVVAWMPYPDPYQGDIVADSP